MIHPLPRRTQFLVILTALGVIGVWLLLTPPGVNGKLLAVGYAICHQILERSFLIGGDPLPLCARCTGIYLGMTTGWLLMHSLGRGKAAGFPHGITLFLLSLFVLLMGVDGANSYLHLFPGVTGVYSPHNTLRVVTGIYAGFAVFNGLFPLFNRVIWKTPQETRSIQSWQECLAMCAVLACVVLLVLSERPLFLAILAVGSVFGVVLALTMIGTAIFMTFCRIENTMISYRGLIIPVLGGVIITFIELGGVAILRYALTGTWAGLGL